MIFFNITRNVQCLRLCETGFKIDKLFCLKLSLYVCLQCTLHTCSYVCTSRESLNVSSELCNMCLHFCKPPLVKAIELDRYIGNTHHRGRLWDNRNHRNHQQMMTIGDQSVPMFHDDVTH